MHMSNASQYVSMLAHLSVAHQWLICHWLIVGSSVIPVWPSVTGSLLAICQWLICHSCVLDIYLLRPRNNWHSLQFFCRVSVGGRWLQRTQPDENEVLEALVLSGQH